MTHIVVNVYLRYKLDKVGGGFTHWETIDCGNL